jgi:hypothetical protein
MLSRLNWLRIVFSTGHLLVPVNVVINVRVPKPHPLAISITVNFQMDTGICNRGGQCSNWAVVTGRSISRMGFSSRLIQIIFILDEIASLNVAGQSLTLLLHDRGVPDSTPDPETACPV